MSEAALAALLAGDWRASGRFALYEPCPGTAALAPLALARAPRRATSAPSVSAAIAAPGLGGSRAARRLARAARPDAWRRLRHARGLAPVAMARLAEGRAEVTVWAAFLDFAPASPYALDALAEIVHQERLRGWARWAARARDGA